MGETAAAVAAEVERARKARLGHGRWCGARSPRGNFCTREAGHPEAEHVATNGAPTGGQWQDAIVERWGGQFAADAPEDPARDPEEPAAP